jgi:uncharacterized membrane protein YccC
MLAPRFRLALRSAIAASFALLVALGCNWPYPYWTALMVIVAMSPSLDAGIQLFARRLLGVAVGAFLAFVVVALFGQDRVPFLVASSAVFFAVGVGASSPSFGPAFMMGGIAFAAVSLFGRADYDHTIIFAFYRFAEAAFGLLVFTISHLLIWPGLVEPVPKPPPPAAPDSRSFLGLSPSRWRSGIRIAAGCAISQMLWWELRPPGAYAVVLITCVLMTLNAPVARPCILYALSGMVCGIAASFCVAYLGWAALPTGPETLVFTVAPVLFLFAYVQSAGPPFAVFGIFGSIVFLVAMSFANTQTLDLQAFISKSLGVALGGVVAAFVLRIFGPHAPQGERDPIFF